MHHFYGMKIALYCPRHTAAPIPAWQYFEVSVKLGGCLYCWGTLFLEQAKNACKDAYAPIVRECIGACMHLHMHAVPRLCTCWGLAE